MDHKFLDDRTTCNTCHNSVPPSDTRQIRFRVFVNVPGHDPNSKKIICLCYPLDTFERGVEYEFFPGTGNEENGEPRIPMTENHKERLRRMMCDEERQNDPNRRVEDEGTNGAAMPDAPPLLERQWAKCIRHPQGEDSAAEPVEPPGSS